MAAWRSGPELGQAPEYRGRVTMIGRVSAYWVKILEVANFFPRLKFCIVCDKIGLGHILDNFFTNPSGHPVLGFFLQVSVRPFPAYLLHVAAVRVLGNLLLHSLLIPTQTLNT
jgi:hypothetical protein